MSSRFTPKISAAIWARTVSDPVPRSVAPTSKLNEPSSFSLILAPPMSRYGIAVPCMTSATPKPRFKCGFPGTSFHPLSVHFLSQSMASLPFLTHSTSPLVWIISGTGVLPSLQATLKGWISPARKAFFKRNSSGSNPNSWAINSI